MWMFNKIPVTTSPAHAKACFIFIFRKAIMLLIKKKKTYLFIFNYLPKLAWMYAVCEILKWKVTKFRLLLAESYQSKIYAHNRQDWTGGIPDYQSVTSKKWIIMDSERHPR